jgi:cytochrome c2
VVTLRLAALHRCVAALVLCLMPAVPAAAAQATPAAPGGTYDAAMNYRLHCEGCHKDDGSGQPGFIPDLRGHVSRFLVLGDGRAYLARVPGSAQSLLNDAERAEVLNWIVGTFDPRNLPRDFQPYRADEMARWRHDALSDPMRERARLLAMLDARGAGGGGSAPAPARAPAEFALCAACHPVSSDAAHGIGPNLRGIVGRKSGSASGFTYSAALRNSKLVWDRESLDRFLAAPASTVPGNFMSYPGVSDPAARAAIIAYLEAQR